MATEEQQQEETTTVMEETTAAEDAVKQTVSWADGEPHYLGCASTQDTGTNAGALSPKFEEEGSSMVAVMDENHKLLNTTPPSTEESVQAVRVPDHSHITEPAQDRNCVSSGDQDIVAPTTPTTATTMGPKVNDAGDNGVVPLQTPNQIEEDGNDVINKEYTDTDDIVQGVIVSPSLALENDRTSLAVDNNHIDQVCLCRSMSTDSDGAILTTTFSDDAAEYVILPPSMRDSPTRTPVVVSPSNSMTDDNDESPDDSPAVVTPPAPAVVTPPKSRGMKYIQVYTDYSANQLMSLPIDSLHCVASFLTPLEWAQYGQTCSAASKISREIFRRVRMHGFRCATEVVSAWVSIKRSGCFVVVEFPS